ncbi:Hint domain-containing protein [Roseomonas elaeocarpi]|uniref:Hint domain-containing protein n=1 Tax=Roseomonas elaeocarpi TaxID=907779 RepID=UPI0036704C0E
MSYGTVGTGHLSGTDGNRVIDGGPVANLETGTLSGPGGKDRQPGWGGSNAGGVGNDALTKAGDGATRFTGGDTLRPGDRTPKVACYATGTLITTARGDVAVEELRVGDLVQVVSGKGGWSPVTWIGRRDVDLLRHPQPERVWPVRVRVGTFGRGWPDRDLILSPNHGLWLRGLLVPVRFLLDGVSVVQERHEARITYWHVELPQHAAILAEGLPAESYLDTGNRSSFSNGGVVVRQHPDFDDGPSLDGPGNRRLAPRIEAGDERLGPIRDKMRAPRTTRRRRRQGEG